MDDEKFFTRKIVKRNSTDDGCEEITLSCGHELVAIPQAYGDEMDCGQCVNDYVDKHRAENGG